MRMVTMMKTVAGDCEGVASGRQCWMGWLKEALEGSVDRPSETGETGESEGEGRGGVLGKDMTVIPPHRPRQRMRITVQCSMGGSRSGGLPLPEQAGRRISPWSGRCPPQERRRCWGTGYRLCSAPRRRF